jgi:hypothetical protein
LRTAELVVELTTEKFPDWTPKIRRPPKLDLAGALRLRLCWLRRNMTFEELGEVFVISATIACEYAHGMTASTKRAWPPSSPAAAGSSVTLDTKESTVSPPRRTTRPEANRRPEAIRVDRYR